MGTKKEKLKKVTIQVSENDLFKFLHLMHYFLEPETKLNKYSAEVVERVLRQLFKKGFIPNVRLWILCKHDESGVFKKLEKPNLRRSREIETMKIYFEKHKAAEKGKHD
jgi:hypothetical protein